MADLQIIAAILICHQISIVIAAGDSVSISGDLSLYPGENASIICSVNTSMPADVMFHWTRFFNGTSTTTILPVDQVNTIGSASGIAHNSTFNLSNVNYTDDGSAFQCNVLGNASDIANLTVLTPVILTLLPVSPILTQVGDTINLTCRGLGGPRLVLSWLKNSSEVASGQMGMTSLTFSLDLFDGCDFGNYTCFATIDDMQQSSTVLVAARAVSSSSDNEQSCTVAIVPLTILLVMAIIGLMVSVMVNIMQKKNKKLSDLYDCTKHGEVNTDIELSAEEEAKANKTDLSEPDYVAVIANTGLADQPYEDMTIGNVKREPQYKGVTAFVRAPDPEYEVVTTNYRKQDVPPRAPVYTNTLEIKGARTAKQ